MIGDNHFKWVYIGEDISKEFDIETWICNNGDRIDISGALQETALSLRQPYIDYVGKLNIKNKSILWWAASLSETNTLRSKLFLRICFLKICTDIVKSHDNIVFFIDDIIVRQAAHKNISDSKLIGYNLFFQCKLNFLASSLMERLVFIIRNIYKIIISKHFYSYKIPNHKIVLLHTWVDNRSFGDDGEYNDAYFGSLDGYISKSGRHVVIFPYILHTVSYLKTLLKINKCNEKFIMPESFLNFKDILKSAYTTFTRFPKKTQYVTFFDLNIDDIIYADDLEDWGSSDTSANILYYYIIKNCKLKGLDIESFIYGFENHSRQKVFCAGLRQFFPSTKIIGHQHGGLSLMLLDHYISKYAINIVPLPDWIITNGIYSYNILIGMGYNPSILRIGGAIRYEKLLIKNNRQLLKKSNLKNPTILVTFSYGKNEATELMAKILKSFKSKPEYTIICKLHPTMHFSRVEKDIKKLGGLPKHFIMTTRPIYDLLDECELLIYTSSTTCIEALVSNVPVLWISSDYTLNYNPLESTPELFSSAKSSNEIIKMVDIIINMTEEELNVKRKQWENAANDFFGPVTSDTLNLFLS